jgi:biopolymer transport protein ExbB
VDNPYGLEALWAQGDFVSKGTLIILALMSMASWYVLVVKLVDESRMMRHAKAATAFWKAASVAEGTRLLAEDSPLRFVASAGMDAALHHQGSLTEKIDLHTWISMSIQRAVGEIVSELQGGLALLATVGSTAPFVGLFGTVWGIYHALTAIGIAGQAAIDKVAGPVGEALIMTAFGLAVAVPAVLGYNLLVRRNKLAAEKVRAFAADLHAVLLAGSGTGAGLRVVR